MNIEKTIYKLKEKGYQVSLFQTGEETISYLRKNIQEKTIGFGGSQTLTDLNLRTILSDTNTVYAPDFVPEEEALTCMANAAKADLFFLSANAVSDDGDIINIDYNGNRLASSLYGHEKVYYFIGTNKIGGTLDEAIHRARNIASPKNALRLHCKTPCAMAVVDRLEKEFRAKYNVEGSIDQLAWQRFIEGLNESELGTHCYNCKSPQRICASLLIHMEKPHSMKAEVIIINDAVGF